MPHGVLFRGNREADIRRNLVKRGLIKGVIGLPANLFYGTGIPACIVVIDKENAVGRRGIFMIDASKGFQKERRPRSREAQAYGGLMGTPPPCLTWVVSTSTTQWLQACRTYQSHGSLSFRRLAICLRPE